MKAIIKKDKKELNIKSRSYGVKARLKSIYTQDSKLYFHASINNKSNLPYEVDYVSFKIKDRRIIKRTTIQELVSKLIRSYSDVQTVNSQSRQDSVFILEQFTLHDKQVLLIEVNEKNGVRNQALKVRSSEIFKSYKNN